MAHLYFIGGSKGGVGKSMVSIALCDYLTQHNIVVPIWRTRGRVRVSIGQATERGREMENRGQR